MSNLTFPIVLQILAVFVIIVEVIIPTGGILAILSTGLVGGSLYMVFTGVSKTAGYAFVAADLVVIPAAVYVGLKLLARSPAALKKSLTREDGVQSQSPELEGYLGMDGVTVTDLRPSGVALIDGKRLDVVSRGEYLEKNSPVTVIAVTGNQIIVRQKE